jgi:hypothetical protein
MKARAWNVYLNGRLVDTVWFDEDCDADYVLRALVEHDGYDPRIRVSLGRAPQAVRP